MSRRPIHTEETELGAQVLVPGIRPVSLEDKLQLLRDAPLAPRVPQRPLCVGLFDDCARNQLDMFIHTKPK